MEEDILKLNFQNSEKSLSKSSTLPLYTTIMLSKQKSKYNRKKFPSSNIIQKNIESSEISNLTREISINNSNIKLIKLSGSKPKGRVSFLPNSKLVSYIDYNPKESIYRNNTINEEDNEKEKNEKKEANKENLQCTCILF